MAQLRQKRYFLFVMSIEQDVNPHISHSSIEETGKLLRRQAIQMDASPHISY
jgi:hypothetical protein